MYHASFGDESIHSLSERISQSVWHAFRATLSMDMFVRNLVKDTMDRANNINLLSRSLVINQRIVVG